jgi:hypothetical protein
MSDTIRRDPDRDRWSSEDEEPVKDKKSSQAESDSFELGVTMKPKSKRQPVKRKSKSPEAADAAPEQAGDPSSRKSSNNNKKQALKSVPKKAAVDSDSEEDEDLIRFMKAKKHATEISSSPPSFMSKRIMDESKMKQSTQIRSKIRRLQDVAAAAPARTKAEKNALIKFYCYDCETYYATFPNRTVDSSACRHRRLESRPVSPPHYWDLDMVPSPEPADPETDPEPQSSGTSSELSNNL